MYALRLLAALTIVAGCSRAPGANTQPARGSSANGPAAGSGDSPRAPSQDEPTVAIASGGAPSLITPYVPSAGAGSAGSGEEDVPMGCEVGKFCPPSEPDAPNCGTLTLKTDVEVNQVPGNLLLIFDQSLSMADPWGNGGQSKLQAAQTAIASAIMSLQSSLTVGALFFPTYACVPALPPPPGGAVTPIEGEGQIPFQPGPMFLESWMQHWTMPGIGLGIGTPMQEAFDRADVALTSAMLTGSTAVVAVTDGAPTCFPDPALTMTPTDLEVNRAAKWLAVKGVKTYVVGLPGATGVQLLNDVAAQGGTTQYILPDDPAALEAKLKEVVQETVKTTFKSCSINLTPAADPADGLQMVVVEASNRMKSQVPHMLTPTAGWTITADGKHVEITGDLCKDAMAGRFSAISFEYKCKDTPELPVIQPM